MDAFDTHPLSSRFSAGRIPRHSGLSDDVRRGLSAAGIPSMLEPSGLDRGDGKRSDGTTAYPYSRGRCLFWNATCVNTFVSSNLRRAALAIGPSPTPTKSGKSPTHHLPARSNRDVRFHGENDDPIFLRFWSPIGRAISGSKRERFPVSESVRGYSQRERVQHFAVIP